ncbi:hypothetical protein DXG01_007233, partial [Tephrocybe rancida]
CMPLGDAMTGSSSQSAAGPTAPASTATPGPSAKKKPCKKPPKKAPSTPPKPKRPSDWHLHKLQVPVLTALSTTSRTRRVIRRRLADVTRHTIWQGQDPDEFMEDYGKDVLKEYILPTDTRANTRTVRINCAGHGWPQVDQRLIPRCLCLLLIHCLYMAPPTPPTGPGPSSTGKWKWSDGPPRQPEVGSSTATPPPNLPTKKLHTSREKKKRTEKEVKSRDWHRKFPEDTKAVKTLYELHICTLWELVTQNDALLKITEPNKAPFLAQFSTENKICQTVTASLDANTEAIQDASRRVKKFQASLDTALENGSSLNASNMKRIKEEFLLQTFCSVAMLGLPHWVPDVLSNDPDDLYIFLHEQCAYQTFRQIVAAYGYSFLGVNMSQVEDWALCRKIFRSFCYSYMQKAAKIEAKSPGGLKKKNEADNVTSRCEALADKRLDYLKAEGFPRRVIALAVETEAHSNDEFMNADPESGRPKPVYWRKIKEGRSVKTTALFCMVDERHIHKAAHQRSGNLKCVSFLSHACIN